MSNANQQIVEVLAEIAAPLGIKYCRQITGSNWWHIRGNGPCNWAQLPPNMPVHPSQLDEYTFAEAGDEFRSALRKLNESWPT